MAKAGRVSPVQVGVLIVGLIAMGYLVYSLMRPTGVTVDTEIVLADVTTGQLFSLDTAKGSAFIPEVNPDTGKETLFPVIKDEQGNWVITPNHRGSVRSISEKPVAISDLRSGRVNVASQDIKPITRK